MKLVMASLAALAGGVSVMAAVSTQSASAFPTPRCTYATVGGASGDVSKLLCQREGIPGRDAAQWQSHRTELLDPQGRTITDYVGTSYTEIPQDGISNMAEDWQYDESQVSFRDLSEELTRVFGYADVWMGLDPAGHPTGVAHGTYEQVSHKKH